MNAVTLKNITKADVTADEAGQHLALAARAVVEGKAQADIIKGRNASALAIMVAGFTSEDVTTKPWAFDIAGNDKGQVHHHVKCIGTDQFGGTEGAWRYNTEGATSKIAQSAYKAAFQNVFFNLPEPVAAVWTMASKAVPIAKAIIAEGMTATIADGALKLEGGDSDRAKAMREAKTMAALAKAVGGATGTDRAEHGNAKSGETDSGVDASDMRAATPEEILRAAAALVTTIAKGEEAVTNAALSFARAIAATVTKNKEAFAEA